MVQRTCTECGKTYESEDDGYAHICSDCKWKIIADWDPEEEERKALSAANQQKEVKHPFLILGLLLAFVVGLCLFGSWGLDKGDTAPCTPTTRTIKNIQTIDDKVVEFDKQEVEGCITNDGYFIPRPDY